MISRKRNVDILEGKKTKFCFSVKARAQASDDTF